MGKNTKEKTPVLALIDLNVITGWIGNVADCLFRARPGRAAFELGAFYQWIEQIKENIPDEDGN